MNELRHQINSQLKASGVSQGINYKSYSNQHKTADNTKHATASNSHKQSSKNIGGLKGAKNLHIKKRTEGSEQQMSQVLGANESLQMKINKKRIQSSTKQPASEVPQQQLIQSHAGVPGHHRIVSNPVTYNHENLTQMQQMMNKSRKNLSSQQSQSKIRGYDNQGDTNTNPTQQILKLRAQALAPGQSMSVKSNDKEIRHSNQQSYPQSQKNNKREARQNQQKMAQILAMENKTNINNQQITQQMMMNGLNTINNDVNSRQQVHEHNIANPNGPPKKGNHNKAFSMSTYVLQKQIPKTQQISAHDARMTTKMQHTQNNINLHQKSQTAFNGNGAGPNTFDGRKTYQNNMTINSQGFSNNSMAKLMQQNNTVNHPAKKKSIKQNTNMYMPQNYPQQQPHGNTVGGNVPHNIHRRIMSQQNPLGEQSQGNMDQYINPQDLQSQSNIGSSGKIVVINNNNTNINIHHQSPYHGGPTQYPQMMKQQNLHKKNTQSFNIPSSHQARTPAQQPEPKKNQTYQGKAYTYVNSTIKNSINNSLNQGVISQDQINPTYAINNFVGEEDIRSQPQLSPDDKHNKIPKSQKTFNKLQSSNAQSAYSYNQSKKQSLKRGKVDPRAVHNPGNQTNPTNPSVVSGGVIPTQASNQNIKYSVQSQMQLAHQQKLYHHPGGITSVGSTSSIGDKIEKVKDPTIKGKTRQTSQNKSATRQKSSHIASREMIEPKTFNQNSHTQMRKVSKNSKTLQKKQDHQVQMHQGDISSSNFLNSERSSLNQKREREQNKIQAVPQSNQQSTIQYSHAQQNNYLKMFHNTEDNRRPPNALSEQSASQLNSNKHYVDNQNSFSQERLKQPNSINYGKNQVQDSYFNVVNNSIINTQGATRGVNHHKMTSAGQIKDTNLSKGQKQLQKMLNQNINQFSPNTHYKNNKQTNTTKSHQRGASANITTEQQEKPASNSKKPKKLAGHRKVESHDQAILERLKNNPTNYYNHKRVQSDVQSYNNYSNSENIRSDHNRYTKHHKDEKSAQYSQLSNRQKIPHIEKSVPVSEISLQGTIVETVPSELKNIPKIMNSPTKQTFPNRQSNMSSPNKKGSPKNKSPSNFFKKTVIQSDNTQKYKTPMKDKKNEKKSKSKQITTLNSGALTPKKLIYNSIISNIRENIFDTKIDYYKIGKVIGKGAFGKVNLAIHRLTGKFVALKSINKTFMKDESSLKKVRQEYNILKRARHQNIVRLYESFETESHIVYVMEVCGGGDLLTYVRRRRKLKEEYAKFIFRQIILGIQYVHHKGVLHRDIKLDNILLTSEGDVKICDFGVSKLVPNKNSTQTEQCGTPAYIAPEVFKGKGYKGFQSDIWSAGVVLYAMLYGTVPFKATNMHELQAQIINLQCTWGAPGEISQPALTMLKKVLEVDPSKRLTPHEILNEPWMQLTDKQLEEIEVFNDYEKEKIASEFLYYNEKQEDMNNDPFLEQELQTTQNSVFKNNTTKSIILAPFNSTRSHISDNYLTNEGILPLIVDKEMLEFADKCKEVNRQYMLNNNAELDNGVYNENEEEEKEKELEKEKEKQKDDGLLGMNMQIENKSPQIIKSGSPSAPRSKFESKEITAHQSLNTSQEIMDEEKMEQVCELFLYEFNYLKKQLVDDELNHATTTYFLIDQEKEF